MNKFSKRYDWTTIKAYYDTGHTFSECKKKFGFGTNAWAEAIKAGKIIRKDLIIPLEQQLIENCKHSRTHLKKKLLVAGLIINVCYVCHMKPQWNDKLLIMVLDHINGISDDYRLDNLRLLCPNCNSQTETFAGRNLKYSRFV